VGVNYYSMEIEMKKFFTKKGTDSNVRVEKTICGFRTFKTVCRKDHKGRDVKVETLYHGSSFAEAVHTAKKIVKRLEEIEND